jgi:hypothetical protein
MKKISLFNCYVCHKQASIYRSSQEGNYFLCSKKKCDTHLKINVLKWPEFQKEIRI